MPNKFSVIVIALALNAITIYAQERVSIADFGAKTFSGKNVIPPIQNALKSCAIKDSSVLVFPKGRYDFFPDSASSQPTIGFAIKNMKNLTIDAGGSEFIFHGNMQIANLFGCTNIKLCNFSVDWDCPYIVQGQYVKATEEYIDMQIDPNVFVIENNQLFLIGEGWKYRPTGYFTLYDKDKKEILYKTHDGVNKEVLLGKAEEIKPGIVRFYGKPSIKPEPGTFQVFYAGTYITTGIEMAQCKNTLLKDITIYHALSNGVLCYRSENITMDNVNITVNEKKGRVFSIIADASHFSGNKGLIKIINCKHTGQGDDFVNIHGKSIPISRINNEYSVFTSRQVYPNSVGDQVWFVNKHTSQRGEVRTIKSIEKIDSVSWSNITSKITFTQPIPNTVQPGDYLENKTWNPRVEIRHCEILKKHRARGILVTTPEKVIIENNYFSSAGTAILIEGDADYWFESGANNDVTIRNNVFEDCLTSGCETGKRSEWGEAIITITPSHFPENDTAEPYHRNIKIENNTFKTFDAPLVHARSVRELTFTENEIIKTQTFEPYTWQKSAFFLDGCRDVSILWNRISNDYSTRLIEIEHMKKSDVKVGQNQKFSISAIDKLKKTTYIDDFKIQSSILNFYVDPVKGKDSNIGTSVAKPFKTIAMAQSAVRLATKSKYGEIVVNLRGGTYFQNTTLAFGENDCGTENCNITYRNYNDEAPVISGGQVITGWKLFDKAKNIYRAKAGDFSFRQLYINGKWGIRARTPNDTTNTDIEWNIANKTIRVEKKHIAQWPDFNKVEIVTLNAFTANHMRLESFSTDSVYANISIQNEEQVIFRSFYPPAFCGKKYFFENAYEFIDSPGEWYLNTTDQYLYYKPGENEDMAVAEVIAPKLTNIIKIEGKDLGSVVSNLKFKGISFMHSTWLRPDNFGYVELQAAQYLMPNAWYDSGTTSDLTGRPASGVLIKNADRINFERCRFANMGATACDLISGVRDIRFVGNVISDIAGNGLCIGLTAAETEHSGITYQPSDEREIPTNVLVSNNYITRIGNGNIAGVGIMYGYVRDVKVEHNEVCDVPYTAISGGWGWNPKETLMRNNAINNNFIHDFMKVFYDGGGIYILSNQPNSFCTGNYIENMKVGARGIGWNAIYADEGTRHVTITDNVCEIQDEQGVQWLSMQSIGTGSKECTIHNNFTNSKRFGHNNQTITNTHFFPKADWPKGALQIIGNAGLEGAFKSIK